MDIPMNLAFEQAKQELAACINYCLRDLGVAPFMMNTILKDFNSEVAMLAQQELKQASDEYAKAQEEAQKEAEATTESEN